MKNRKIAGCVTAALCIFLVLCFGACGAASSGEASRKSDSQDAEQSDGQAADSKEIQEQNEKKDDGFRIGIVVKDNQRDFWQRMQKAAQEACDEAGAELLFLADTGSTDPEGQIRKVDDLIGMDADAICVSPISDEMLIPAMQRAADKDIPVFAVDSDTGFPEKAAYIGTDHYEAAKAGAAYAAELAGKGASAVIMRGTPGDGVHDLRQKGIEDALAEAGVTIEKVLCSGADTAAADAARLIGMYPELDLIMTTEDGITAEAWKAVRKSENTDIRLYGYDGETEVVRLVEKHGQVIGTTAQDPEEMGRQCIETVIKYLNGGEIPRDIYTPWRIINEENAGEYLAEEEDKTDP